MDLFMTTVMMIGTKTKTSTKESDGGHDGSGPYRGGKYQIYEGGTRVPFIIRWPAKIKAGQTSKAMMNQIDFIASFASFLNVEIGEKEAIDSRNVWKSLIGEEQTGLPYMLEEARGLAVRKGPWKYIAKTGKTKKKAAASGQLYNLDKDIGEQKNVINEYPEIAKEMKALMEKLKSSEGVRKQ